MTRADLGRATEARFLMDAQLRGFLVAQPFNSVPGYDAIVDTGHRVYRVQIKDVRQRLHYKNYVSYHVISNRRGLKTLNYDILAIWLVNDGKWLLIPAKLTRAGSLCISPSTRFHRFSEKWEIFR
jgi:hypothetical protein